MVKVTANLDIHKVVDSIKYQTSRTGSITKMLFNQMNTNRTRNVHKYLLFLSIGANGCLYKALKVFDCPFRTAVKEGNL